MEGEALTSRQSRTLFPAANYTVMLAMTCVFAVQMLLDPGATRLSGLVLAGYSAPGLLGHMWLHMSMVHLVGNLLSLWVFGRCVSPKVGGLLYVLAYVAAGVGAGFVHMKYDGRPVIGASGAIMGVLAMHVVICFRQLGRLGPWLILTWFLATLGVGLVGDFPCSYMAHIGGFLSGMVVAFCLVVFRAVDYDRTDGALLAVLRIGVPKS